MKADKYHTNYELYTFTGETEFTNVWNYQSPETGVSYYYMNWGWGGYNNGYYSVSSLKLPGYNENMTTFKVIYDISYNR